jgi:hypothetical protein
MLWLGTVGGWELLDSSRIMRLCEVAQPQTCFILETEVSGSRVSSLRWSFGLRNCLSIDSVGLSGGLALFWDESINVTLLSQGERYFDVVIKEDPGVTPWRATFIYGEPRVENRGDMWDLLRDLCGVWSGPWMVIGDFNEVMWRYEHFSETPKAEQQMILSYYYLIYFYMLLSCLHD